MLLVVDFNTVFSALVTKGVTFKAFMLNGKLKKFEFISPEFINDELTKNKSKILSQTKLSSGDFEKFLASITSQIKPILAEVFLEKLSEAIELNKKDSPYLALALKRGCSIFSGDKELSKQSKVKVLSPRQLLDILESDFA